MEDSSGIVHLFTSISGLPRSPAPFRSNSLACKNQNEREMQKQNIICRGRNRRIRNLLCHRTNLICALLTIFDIVGTQSVSHHTGWWWRKTKIKENRQKERRKTVFGASGKIVEIRLKHIPGIGVCVCTCTNAKVLERKGQYITWATQPLCPPVCVCVLGDAGCCCYR